MLLGGAAAHVVRLTQARALNKWLDVACAGWVILVQHQQAPAGVNAHTSGPSCWCALGMRHMLAALGLVPVAICCCGTCMWLPCDGARMGGVQAGTELRIGDGVQLQPRLGEDVGRIMRLRSLWSERLASGRDCMFASAQVFERPEV